MLSHSCNHRDGVIINGTVAKAKDMNHAAPLARRSTKDGRRHPAIAPVTQTPGIREAVNITDFSPPSSGLQGCRRFQSSALNYSTMLLEAESGRLYVGARGAAFALNASDVSAGGVLTVSLFLLRCCGGGMGRIARRNRTNSRMSSFASH